MELLSPFVLAEPDEHEAVADEERPFDEHAVSGEQLDGLLRARRNHLSGVLNGIDMDDYNPATDPQIVAHYTADEMAG